MDALSPLTRPTVTIERHDDVARLVIEGDWTIQTSREAEAAIEAFDCGDAVRVEFCLGGVRTVDSAGAWIIHRERASMEFHGRTVSLINESERMHFLVCEIERHIPVLEDPPRQPFMVVRALMLIGETMVTIGRDAVAMLSILGVFGLRLATAFTAFRRLRITSILSNFDRTCRGAVPIVMLMSFLIGLIIAQQGGFYLATFGADLFVVDLAGVLILREIGVLLAAILVAGRSGS
ncbi:MAG: ABC transporter permease, partial [Pseudomonadota bacterium]